MKKILFVFIIILFSCLIGKAQPANDNCTTAQNIGTLPTPPACSGTALSVGATVNIAGTLVGATEANPYIYMTGCSGAGGPNMGVPANDVWYTFTASGYQGIITVTGTFANPNIALYSGNCIALGGGVGGCAVGTGGTVTLQVDQLVPGSTYYLQVSGNTGQSGTFNMAIHNNVDCNNCLVGSTMTVNPLPVNGMYTAGQTVNFCFHVSNYTTINTNWLHGVQLTFGAGWNLASLTTTSPPACQGYGYWAYYPGGCTSTATGVHFGPGFYFEDVTGANNPADNFGDYCFGAQLSSTWNFCFSITAAAGCSPGSNLDVIVNTSGDGESGSWSNLGCAGDPATSVNAVGACCPPTMSSVPTTCVGNNGTATATPVGSSGPYDYSWANSGGTIISTTNNVVGANTISGLAPGTYTVSITNANNCLSTNTIVVANGGVPIAVPTAGSNSPICVGGTLNLTAANIVGATYAWSGPNSFGSAIQNPSIAIVTPGASGVYTVTATLGGCTNTSSVNVVINPLPTVTVNSPTICSGTTANLTANGATTYAWTGGLAGNPATTPILSGNTSYTVTGTTSGCTGTAISTVTITPLPTVTVNSPTICSGTTATLTANGATTYAWSGGLVGNPATTLSLSATTTYTVTGTSSGCTGTAIATVSIAPSLSVTVNSPTICSGTTATLTANGATTYVWTGGLTGNPATTLVLNASTTYTVTGTTTGCTGTAISTVTVTPLPTVTVNSPTICSGTTASLTANGATTYTWTGGLAGNPATTPVLSASTPYTVTGTASGCTGTAISNVTVTPLPTVTVNSPTICSGTTATLTANGATTYTWTGGLAGNPATTPILSASTPYTVTGTSSGCTGTAISNVTVTPLPTVTVNSPTICSGTTANLTANGATTYLWTGGLTGNPATTPVLNASTTYTVTGTTTGCTGTAISTVTVTPLPTVTVNSPTICSGTTATLTANGATTYTWTGGLAGNPATTPILSSSTPYTVTGTSSGCSGTAISNVTITPLPTVTVNSPAICSGTTATLTANGATTYLWTGGLIGNPVTTPILTLNTTYTVTGTSLGCSNTAISTVNVNSNPTSIASSTAEHCGHADGTANANPAGGTPPYSYNWGGPGISNPITSLTANTYTVTVTDANGCTASSSTTISNIAGPSAPFGTIVQETCTSCNGSIIILPVNGTLPYSYSWSNGGTNSSINSLCQGLYSVVVTDANNCTASNQTTITDSPAPIPTTSMTSAICDQATGTASVVSIGGTGIYSYLWSTGAISNSINNLSPGNYCVTVNDGSCTVTSCVEVLNIPGPTANFTVSPTLMTIEDASCVLTDQSIGAAAWNWNFGDGTAGSVIQNPSHIYLNTGSYEITLLVTDLNGCIDSITHPVMVKGVYLIYIPNAFTPNGDGINDFFSPTGLNIDLSNFEMFIFDRWGKQFYYTQAITKPWNGTLDNAYGIGHVVQDVYVYKILTRDLIDGAKHEYVGRVTIVQ